VEQSLMDRESAQELTVGEVMLSRPKTLPSDSTVADVRRLFAKPNVRTALVVDGDTFVGTIERGDVPEAASDDEQALAFARTDAERVEPDVLVRDAMPRLERSSEGRLVVVDRDGETLRGLVCLKGAGDAFCVEG
jgi:CBS domain-containing protein